jgi:nucleoside-diphosphate kinase
MERTFAIIKPDAVKDGHTGEIIKLIELNKFTIVAMEKVNLSEEKAQEFYAVHKERPFFGELVSYMTSGPVVIMALEKENAIQEWRDLMGATNPAQAAPGTLRRMFGKSIGSNATHGSDSPVTAASELKLFFPQLKA